MVCFSLLSVVLAHGRIHNMATISLAGVGNTNINQVGTITTGTWQATPVTEAYGGTNQTAYTTGDLLYASASNTLSRLAFVSTATRYLSNTGVGSTPAWAQINLANGVTGNLPVANGGTNKASFTAYALICAGTTSTGTFQNVATLGNAGEVLTSNGAGALPSWGTAPSGLAASQAQMEAASATNVYTSPGRQQYHPGHPKAWVSFDASSGAPVINESYNVTSITDNGTGSYQANFTVSFSGTRPCVTVSAGGLSGGGRVSTTIIDETASYGWFETYQITGSPGNSDATFNSLAAWGDQ